MAAFAVAVIVAVSFGSTAPAVGEIVSQVAPGEMVYVSGSGPAVMVNVPVRVPGEVSGMLLGVTVAPPAGSITTRVTARVTGLKPLAATLTVAVYVPGASVSGFTATLSEPGSEPVSGVAVSHAAFVVSPAAGTIVAVYEPVPLDSRSDTFCVDGSVAPICHAKLSAVGVALRVGLDVVPARRVKQPALSSAAMGRSAKRLTAPHIGSTCNGSILNSQGYSPRPTWNSRSGSPRN